MAGKRPSREKRLHWAFGVAGILTKTRPGRKKYTAAAGITPSGTIHMGNFREVMTVELIARAIRMSGMEARFIYSWDDFDVFRKLPANMPEKDRLKECLRTPISMIPDTFGCGHSSFANHNEALFEASLSKVGIRPEFISQEKLYRSCAYADEINHCLKNSGKIKAILDERRKEPLPENWLPVTLFCSACSRDTIESITYPEDYHLSYRCICGNSEKIDFRKKGIVKLKWRVDWPMRWHHEGVDCEPAGKDHFAAGGSRETGVRIQKELWNENAPYGFMYEWIGIKGGKQFSSSKGFVTTLDEVLEVYEPAIVRWLFASTRPNTAFSISFDLDVLSIYEEYDKCERIYYGQEKAGPKETQKQKEIYLLSAVEPESIPKAMPFQPSFRHLCNILQINSMDMEKTVEFYRQSLKGRYDEERLRMRARCASSWIRKHAPEDFRFSVLEKAPEGLELSPKIRDALKKSESVLRSSEGLSAEELHERLYSIIKECRLEPKEFFSAFYRVLINRDKGPRLASFILEVGKEKVLKLLSGI